MGGAASAAARARASAIVLAVVMTACGGGGSSTPASAALPEVLTLATSATRAPLGTSVTLTSNADDPAGALSYHWAFGDGATGTQARASHAYAKAGVYSVLLTVTDAAGRSRSASTTLYVSDVDVVKGRSCSGSDSSGWCWQRPLPQGNAIADYHFVSDSQGWAVGDMGTILATTDAGVTWTPQPSGTDQPLTRVVFVDALSGWVASTNGQVLRTTDGGAHWQAMSIGQADASQLAASSASQAWVDGSYGTAPRFTQDGGSHWDTLTPPNNSVQSYHMVSTMDVWAVVWGWSSPTLLHTVDAGTTWTPVALPPLEGGLHRTLTTLHFADPLHGWALFVESGYPQGSSTYVSRLLPLRTADAGASWEPFAADAMSIGYSTRLTFVDTHHGFAWNTYSNSVLRTADAGATWQPVTLPWTTGTYHTFFRAFSSERLLVKDAAGRAYLSNDGGTSWSDRSADGASSPTLNSVWFFDSREGLAFGDDGSALRTSDGGQTWTATASNAPYAGWRRAQFTADAGTGWIISDTGTIYRSTDKGASWLAPVPQTSPSLYGVSDFHFVDGQNGWAVSPYASDASIFRSVNGGSSWQPVAGTSGYGGITSVRFADTQHGVAVGPPGLALVTSDGGSTWNPRPTGSDRSLRRVVFVDDHIAVAVGDQGVILRSLDRGMTWSKVSATPSTSLADIRFASPRMGIAVGDSGTVLVSYDGGASWTLQPTAVSAALRAVHFTDEQTGWIVGTNGTVLATATGGE